jgi:hypothetical protein
MKLFGAKSKKAFSSYSQGESHGELISSWIVEIYAPTNPLRYARILTKGILRDFVF